MKKMIVLATFALLLPLSAVSAVESQHHESKGKDKAMQTSAQQGQEDMMGVMQKNLRKMMDQMDQIHSTRDLEKRRRLMHEHMQSMHDGMQMMRTMGGSVMMGKMGSKEAGGQMMGKDMDMEQRQQMMGQRMDMMLMMMEQMMNQMMNQMMAQEGVKPTPKKPPHQHKKIHK